MASSQHNRQHFPQGDISKTGAGWQQAKYKPHLEEEIGGDPHATYAYASADAAAKLVNKDTVGELRLIRHVLAVLR